jgi:hypothetical protein
MNPLTIIPSPTSASDIERMLQAQFQHETLPASAARALSSVQTALDRQKAEEQKLAYLLSRFVPELGASAVYRTELNMFTGEGYTSLAGNTYFSGVRLTLGAAIKFDIGIGYAHVFLNGISVYATDGRCKLLAHRRFSCYFYSEAAARRESTLLICQVILDSLSWEERDIYGHEAMLLAERIIAAAFDRPQTETLRDLVLDLSVLALAS